MRAALDASDRVGVAPGVAAALRRARSGNALAVRRRLARGLTFRHARSMRMSPETVRKRSLTGRRAPLAAASVGDGRLTLPLIVEISGSTRMPVGSPRRTSPDTVRIATDAPV